MDISKKEQYKSFWRKDAKNDSYYISPKTSPSDIERIETKLGYMIPDAYKKLMEIQNGGKLKKQYYEIKDASEETVNILRCEILYGIWDDDEHTCLLSRYIYKKKDGKHVGNYDFPIDGFMIGKWVPDSGWGNCYFYLDYSVCKEKKEPQVCAYEMKWSSKDGRAVPVSYKVADSFEMFINGLLVKPDKAKFDFISFEKSLIQAVKETILIVQKKYPEEKIVAFGFYTNDDGSMVSTSVNTEKHLKQNLMKDATDEEYYRYSTNEWAFESDCDGDICIQLTREMESYVSTITTIKNKQNFKRKVIESLVSVLERVRMQGLYTEFIHEDMILMVGTAANDMSKALFQKFIKRLNS